MKRERKSPSSLQDEAAAWVARCDAGLSAAEQRELDAWIAADPRHRAAWAEHGFAWSLLDRPAAGGTADRVLEELGRLDRRRGSRRVFLSATAAALVGAISWWSLAGQRARAPNGPVVANMRVLWPERQTLPDGSVVELKDGAQLTVSFSAAQRRVTLQKGEAHFQVTKDAARPFVVEANGVEVRAVGTAFAVQYGQTVDVVVTEGHVAVDARPRTTARTASERPAQAILSPRQRALIEPGSIAAKVRSLSADEMSERLAWRAPRLELTGTPLADVVARLNEYAAMRREVRFAIGDPAIADVRVSGLFRVDNTAALLELLENGFGITAERDGGSSIVLRKAIVR